jgi:hypothetical protein
VLTQEECRLAGASANGLLVQDSVIIVEPVFGSYRATKDVRVCVDADCGFPGGDDPCDPFPDDGLVTYVYRLTNSIESANSIIGWVVDTGVPGAVMTAGALGADGVAPTTIEVLNDDSQVIWSFFDDPIDPGEQSVELFITSALGPAAVDSNVLGDFALDAPGFCFGPAVEGDFCIGALWQGAGTTCDPNPCDEPMGACCLPNGFCDTLTADACAAAGGTYQGDFVPCTPGLCPQPAGACCFTTGECELLTQAECQQAGGLFQGLQIPCDPNACPQPGACCLPDGSCVQAAELGGADCTQQGGLYVGDNSTCGQVICPQPGACCLPDGSCETAATTGGADCTAAGGAYQGDNTICSTASCPGACCLADGVCFLASGVVCDAVGGVYQGLGTACDEVDCVLPGACCLPNGLCVPALMAGGADCTAQGGVYQGDGTMCDEVDCPQPGACCFDDGSCAPADEIGGGDCTAQGGAYQGDDTTCGPGVCPQPGACCFDDGSCVPAGELGGGDCTAQGGTYQGDDTACDPSPCLQPGACCLPGGLCIQSQELGGADCEELGGTYQGDGTSCSEPDCNGNGINDDCETQPTCDPSQSVAADECADAECLCPSDILTGTTVGSTNDTIISCDGTYGGFYDVWYRYTPAWTGTAVVKVCEGLDAVVSVHTGCPATQENMISCSVDNCAAIFDAVRGRNYYIRIAGFMNTVGEFEIELKGPDCVLNTKDFNGNGIPDDCECLFDVNGDGVVDAWDFNAVVAALGICDGCPEDVDGNGVVDEEDMRLVLLNLGPCPMAPQSLEGGPSPRGVDASVGE